MSPHLVFLPADPRPLVIVFPGLGGRRASLEPLCRALPQVFQYAIVDYPDIDQPLSALMNYDAVIDSIAAAVLGFGRTDKVSIIGYSIGGFLGYRLACKLSSGGLEPKFVGMIDSSTTLSSPSKSKAMAQFITSARSDPVRAFEYNLLKIMMKTGRLDLARSFILAVERLHRDQRTDLMRGKFLLAIWRRVAPGMRLVPYNAPVCLFKARVGRPRLPAADLGWAALCEYLEIVALDGDHWSAISEPNLVSNGQMLGSRLLAAMAEDATLPTLRASATPARTA